jgi:Ca2+-binding RTX toxin-like protein
MVGADGSDYFEIFRASGSARSFVTVDGGDGADEINFANGGAQAKILGGLGDGDDAVYASGGGVQVTLGAGDDQVFTSGGKGSYLGGPGVDSISFESSHQGVSVDLGVRGPQDTGVGVIRISSFENLTGTDLSDSVTGERHGNHLAGGGGDDTIEGDRGADQLSGGTGDDVFVYRAAADSNGAKTDLILDLDAGDHIDLSAIDADTAAAGDQAFHLVDAFGHQAGELVVSYDAGRDRTTISGDLDGDARADLVIWLAGDHRDFAGLQL